MRFCQQCESVMAKSTSTTGQIMFKCVCQLVVPGHDDDTLMAEEYLETAESDQKHEVFIANAPFDAAGNIVHKDCPQCGLNFMTMLRIGVNETTHYTCSCGYHAALSEYKKTTGLGKK
jgi:DNA-directed RNA polymerase subunit M/transcription elongation factor TFIIS